MITTAVSLFSGVGGFDLALERQGINVTAAVEIDYACQQVLARHFPQTFIFTDVREITGADLIKTGFEPATGILTAGWPCQGNSVAGRRRGMADPRSGLWRETVRLLGETHPRWFIGENVPGLLTVRGGADFYEVIKSLDELGYGVAWRVLDAQNFGIPQRRRRVIIVGCLGDGARPAEILFDIEGSHGDSAQGTQAGARVAGALAASAGSGGVAPNSAQGGVGQSANAITSRIVASQRFTRDQFVSDETFAAAVRCQRQRYPELYILDPYNQAVSQSNTPTLDTQGARGNGPVVVSTLQGGGKRGYRIDAEGAAGGHLVIGQNGSDIQVDDRDQVGTLTAGMARQTSGDLVAIPVAHTLTSGVATKPGVNPPGRRNEDDYNLVCVTGDHTHSLTTANNGKNSSEDGTGRGVPIVTADPAYALSAHHGHDDRENNYVIDPPFPADGYNGGAGDPESPMYPLSTQAVHNRSLVGRRLGVRRLTPRECERLQGFPDDWTAAGQSDSARYRQLGNAVAVPVIEWVARRTLEVESTSNHQGGTNG